MSESTLKPFNGKLDDNTDTKQQPALKPFTGALDGEEKGVKGHLQDTGASLMSGIAGAAEAATVGIADLYTEGRVGRDIDNTGYYKLGAAQKYWSDKKTDIAKEQDKTRQNIDGIWGKTKYVLGNFSQLTNAVAESLPYMAGGAAFGRVSKIANPVAASAVGEGAVMAGSQAESIRQQSDDQLLNNGQEAAAFGTGALGSLFGFAGGRIAQKMGLADIDTAMQTGRLTTQQVGEEIAKIPAKDIPLAVVKGAISEGFLEELPQTVSEQVIQNLALDKAWNDGLDDAIVMGTLSGMAMGSGASGIGKALDWYNQPSNENGTPDSAVGQNPMLPAPNGGSGSGGVNGEYIPRENSPEQPNQGRTNFEYDQFSTDADNLLASGTGYNPTQPSAPENPDSPIAPTTPPLSRQLGINPNDGPLSSAAALAVDSGATNSMLNAPSVTDTTQDDVNNNAPLSSAAGLLNEPNENSASNESGTGSSNNGPLGETSNSQLRETSGSISTVANSNADDSKGNNLERPGDSALLSNTIGNDGKDTSGRNDSVNSVSGIGEPSQAAPGQPDRNNLNTIGNDTVLPSENEAAATSSSNLGTTAGDSQNRTVEPILGADGKNKWFGNQDKANAFLEKKNLGNDYQVVQDGKRFEIQPKQVTQNTTPDIENNIEKSQEIADLEQQLTNEKSVPKKTQLRKQITELQNGLVSEQSQSDVPNPYNENSLRANVRNLSLQASKEAQAQNADDSNYVADLGSTASARANEKVKQQFPELYKRAEELAKTAEISSAGRRGNTHFSSLSFKGDSSFVSGDSWTKRPTSDEILQQAIWHLSQDDKNSAPDNKNLTAESQYQPQNTTSKDTFESVRAELKEIESSGYPKDKAQRQARLEKRIELNNKLLSLTGDPSIKREYSKQISKLQESIKILNGERTVRDIANDIEKVRTKRRSVENYEDWINDDLEHARLLRELADTVDDKSSSEHYRKEAEKVEKDTLELRKHAESLSSNTANSGNTTTQAEPEQHAWDQLSVDEKTAVLQKAGWRTNAGGLNVIGKKLAGQTSKQITPETLKTIERFMGNEAPAAPAIEKDDIKSSLTTLLRYTSLNSRNREYYKAASQLGWEYKDGVSVNPENGYGIKTNSRGQFIVDPEGNEVQAPYDSEKTVGEMFTEFERIMDEKSKLTQAKTEQPKPKAEATQKPKVKVSENKVVTEDRRAELEKLIKAKLSQLNSGVDPELIVLGTELALYHIERGVRTFAAYARAMTESLGDSSKPFLKSWYMGVKYDPRASDFDGMSSAAEVESFDLSDLDSDIQGMDSADTVRAELEKLDNPQQDSGENFTELLNGLTEEFGGNNVSIDSKGKTITVKNKGVSTDVIRENGSFSVFSMDEGMQITGPASVNGLQGVISEIDKAIGSYGAYLQAKSEAKAKAAQEKAAAKEAEKQEVGDSVAYEPSSKSVEQQPIIHTEGKKKEIATTDVVKDSFDKAKTKQTKAEYDAMLKGFVADIEAAIKVAPDKPFSIEVPIVWKARTTSDGSPTVKNYVAAKDLMTLDNLGDVIDSIKKTIKENSESYLQDRAINVISDAVNEYQANYGNAPLRIVFDVKGDGRFNVRNDKQTLENFLKKVKNNSGFKPPVKSMGGRETFNRVNAIRDMLKDSGDQYRTLNAYEMAKSMDYPIVYGDYGDYGIIAMMVLETFDYADHTFHTAVQLNDLEGNKKENIGAFSVVTEQGISIAPATTQKEAKESLTKAVKPNEGDKIDRALRNHRSVRNMAEFRPQSELQQQFEAKLYASQGLELPENQEDTANEQPTSSALNPQGTSAVRGGRGRTPQQNDAQGVNPDVEAGISAGSGTTGTTQSTGRHGVRGARENVANDEGVSGRGMESSRREDAGADGTLPTGASGGVTSLAATSSAATDFHMTDPESIIGGTQVKRFDKNKASLELLEELNNEGRQATPEEQAILAGYTGWGSFGQDLFQGTWDKPIFKDDGVWKERNLWLRERLGKESWESAKNSTINAHFTDPYTVGAMWAMAEKMGFTGGRVLEPAIGTGNFISLMPMHIKQRSQVTGIDLDITTAAIAKQLFPESNVQNMPYQKSKTPDNFYDLVISNVPFADIKIADRRYNRFNPNLHDYYFLKMLDQVRPGGIVMAITSSGTMDKQSEVIRRELAKHAELITSVRLPSGAFQEYAGTAVVTDIIVLRKRAKPLTMTPDEKWIKPAIIITPSGKPVTINSFFALNPQNVLGTIDFGSGTTRFGSGMIVQRPHDLKQRLENAANFVPENALLPRHNDNHLTYYANKAGERTNTLTISNGELMFVYGDQMVKATDLSEYKIKDAKKTAQRKKSIEDLVAIRKAYTDLTDAERIEQDNVEQLRKNLNKLYQAYVKEHGLLADSFGLQYFGKLQDAYYYSMAALEVNGKPAEILKRSVVRGAAALQNPTVSDAFVVERNKSAVPNLANIAKMANVSEDQARAELLTKGAVYVLPNGEIMPSDMYLSGNVRLKLEEAQNAVAEGNADLQRNVDALKEVIPEDIPYFNIEAKMGATWVPLSDYEKYIAHMLGMTDSNGITVTFPSGKWKVKLDPIAARRTEATTNYGSKYKSFQTIVSAALSNQNITVKYKNSDGSESVDVQATEEVNERIAKIKEDFATWLWSDPERRVQLEKEYNHTFNAWATPKYDGSFMSMQGMALSFGNGPFNLRQHQQNAIWRAIVNRRSINAHEVGTGKTFTMGGIALESRRYGIAKKPLILAHNANSAAVAKEIQMMYPSARVLFISELGKAVRHIRMRQIANDDWDVVVMPHSMIDKLTLSEETLMAMAADDIAALEAELEEALAEEGGATLEEVLAMDSADVNKKMGFKNPTAKQLAKQRLKLLEDIQKQAMDSSKADALNFEELGVDMIMVDEVHEFKKPSIATRMNMKGLNTSSNKRSVNLQLLTRYVRRMNNGGNVHTFTGTPITNTLTEIYHQMRYVMEEEMQKLNVAAWDGWFGSFATDITDIELSATGEYQLVTRLAGFVNVPELRKMIGQFMDIVFASDMPEMQPRRTKTGKVLSDEGLTEAEKAELLNGRTEDAKDRPYKKVMNITTEMSPKQEQTLAEIQSLAKEWEQASGKQKREWMRNGDPRAPLSISTAAKKASYDARIGDPEYIGQEGKTEDFEMSKASQVVKNVMEVYHSHPLASQVIFADTGYNTTTERSTGQKDGNGKTIRERVKVFSPIKDIVERLVQSGIPREQIAIVDGSIKAEARKAIADKVNTGEIRVVIGLTQTLGVGVNMQRNLRAMHHLDAPWMPGELEQRNGRGLRQGNQWNTVLEYRYITDKLDGKSWQVLAIKDRFINAFMKADGNVRSIEGDAAADNGEDNAGDIMSSFSEASGDPRVLQRIKVKGNLEKLQRKERLHTQGIADMKRTIGNTQRRIARFDEQIAEYENNAILERTQELMQSQSESFSVEVDGVKYNKHKEASDAIQQFIVDHVRTGSSRITLGKYGNVTMSVEWDSLQPQATLSMKIGPIEFKGNTLRGIEGKLRGVRQDIQDIEDAKASAQQTIDSLSKAVEQPFGQSEQLARTQKQLENIENDLENNPVAPPIWLRRGAPIDSEVYYKGKLFIVSGHRYTNDGWFVSAEDAKGTIEIPYLEATDSAGMPIYEEREFEAPNIEDKTKAENDVKQESSSKNGSDTPLYSRRTKGNSGSTVQQVRDVLIDRFGKDVIEELERQGKLEIIQDYDVDGAEGFYKNGKAVLVASNLTAESTVPTFLHELGGHAGFQNMMTDAQYNELMKQFDKLVEQGNPVALAAKRLAEREQGLERQQLEYLPYLLTLASTMQQKNVLQRNALQRLIRNLISHVKASLFDKFGINLNLNPDDMVALAERMVDKAASNAIGNTGTFNSENADIRFSRVDLSGSINRLSKSFKQASAQSTNQWLKNKAKDTLGIALQALTRRQIMEVYGKLLPQLSRYNHIVELMDADATEASVNADNIVNEWAKLEDEQQLAELMHEATLAKIDPAKPFVSGSGTSISKYAQLLKAYNALTPEAQAMYVKARDAYSKHYADVHQAIKERILRSELSNQKKTDLLKQMDDNFFAQSKGVYFPLSRFGKYVVVVRDANGVVESVNRAETLNEAEAVRIELQKQFPNSKVSPVTKDKEFNASRDGVGRGFMSELFKEAGNLGLSAKDQADFEDTLSQLYLASMPDLSWAKHGIHRKGMAGFSQDARRAFAQNMFHGGSYLAKLRYGDQLAEQLDDMQKHTTNEGKKDDAYDQVTAQHVVDEMNSRHESYMNPNPHPVSTALTSLGFVYYLGLSPAAAMVNLSQTALVAYPLMGAKFGFKKSAAALKTAMADFAKGVDVENRNLDITKSLNTDEKKAYEEALRRGVIDKTQVHSLAGVAQGEDSGLSEKLKPIMKWSSFMFHHAERFNREVTFVAAYRLAKEHSIVENGKPRKLTKDEALEMAIDMTYKGHFDYSAGNRARIMQGNVAKVVLLFKQFAQNMIFTLMRQAYLSMYGMDVNERNEARKALAAILAFHGMAAGLLGLPIATSLVAASFLIAKKNPMLGMLFGVGAAAVFFGAGGDDDDPWDLEVEIRNYAAEVLGDDAANYLFKGAPRALGIDLSGRVGLDNLVIPKYQEGLEGQNLSNSVMAGALGPVAGIGANLFKGAQELGDGNLGRAMEAMLPVFMKNPIKAMRYADEGVQDKTGISIQDEVDAWGVFNQTIGFSPADVRLAYEGRSAIYQKKNRLTERRGELMSMWSRARKQDDQEEMDAIWEEIQAFNEINPKIRINRMQLMQSYRQRENRVNKSEDGIYVTRKYEDSREAGAFAFGE